MRLRSQPKGSMFPEIAVTKLKVSFDAAPCELKGCYIFVVVATDVPFTSGEHA
jgi:hypothetical protein